MTMHDIKLSRRSLLKGTAALVIGVHLAPRGLRANSPMTPPLNAFVRVWPDSTVTGPRSPRP